MTEENARLPRRGKPKHGRPAANLESPLAGAAELRGPSPSPIERVMGEYRFQLWYFTGAVTKTVGVLAKEQRVF
ncbi:MAG TPA: hypothetical protein VK163_05330, partial [Opitutaceae bacterium]|nr:hypothetical protein [Opitutaceae bacterium]